MAARIKREDLEREIFLLINENHTMLEQCIIYLLKQFIILHNLSASQKGKR